MVSLLCNHLTEDVDCFVEDELKVLVAEYDLLISWSNILRLDIVLLHDLVNQHLKRKKLLIFNKFEILTSII